MATIRFVGAALLLYAFLAAPASAQPPRGGKGSLTVADGMLYILGEAGTMGLVLPSPEAHAVVSRFELLKGGEGLWWAHPVACNGRLYVRHGEFLYTYALNERT